MFQSKLKAACHLDYEIISGLLVGICCATKRFVLPEFVKMCLHISAEAIKLNNVFHFKRSYFLRSEKKVGSHYFMLKIIKFWAYSFSGKWHCHFYAWTLKLFCGKSRLFMANLGVLTCRKIILHHFSVFIFISRSCFNLFLSIFWKDYFSLKTSIVKKIAHFLPILDKKKLWYV